MQIGSDLLTYASDFTHPKKKKLPVVPTLVASLSLVQIPAETFRKKVKYKKRIYGDTLSSLSVFWIELLRVNKIGMKSF